MELSLSLHTARAGSFEEWRSVARALLAAGVPPHAVQWSEDAEADLFAGAAVPDAQAPAMRLPRKLMEMLETAACYRDPARWALLYRVLWRWQQGERDVISAADPDGQRLHAMVKAVHREEHDMHAYVRFRARAEDDGPRFVAWYEPAHDVLPQVGMHFARRMGRISWMIATPQATVSWDGDTLAITAPLLHGPQEIEDDREALWLTYYRSIFNPARVNAKLMQGHIPARFWKHLPEGRAVPAMVAEAHAGARRVGQAQTVGQRDGTTIRIAPAAAQPLRPLPASLDTCRRCPLWERATQAVPGRGPLDARIMLVGEQPGDQEDLSGEPFIGPAGQVLDEAFAAAQLDRGSVYMTNAVKHFGWEPRGKRRLHKTPGQREIAACRPWLEEELRRVQPAVVVALGATALKALAGPQWKLAEVLGQTLEHDGRFIVPVYHPAYVLRCGDLAEWRRAMLVIADGLRTAQALLDMPPDETAYQ